MDIDPDIRRARTPAQAFYRDPEIFARQVREVIRDGWHLTPRFDAVPGSVQPFAVLPKLAEVPLVLACAEDGSVRCLSNVCTHRANLVVEAAATSLSGLRCRYHGRRYCLRGRFESMPEFDEVEGFPSTEDHLPEARLGRLGPLFFASAGSGVDFDTWLAPVRKRTSFAAWDELEHVASREYDVGAHWALYVENYLEGFHIPYVHGGLNRVIEYDDYRTELFEWGSAQICSPKPGEVAFSGESQQIAALYFWLYPTTMVNVYPWGVSLNAVEPIAINRTRVRFETWCWNEALRGQGAGAGLHRVELEDEAVVESVQRGVGSPLYRRGRYSPKREQGVHHFHRIMQRALGLDHGRI